MRRFFARKTKVSEPRPEPGPEPEYHISEFEAALDEKGIVRTEVPQMPFWTFWVDGTNQSVDPHRRQGLHPFGPNADYAAQITPAEMKEILLKGLHDVFRRFGIDYDVYAHEGDLKVSRGHVNPSVSIDIRNRLFWKLRGQEGGRRHSRKRNTPRKHNTLRKSHRNRKTKRRRTLRR